MYCPNCGAAYTDGANFCEHCGTALSSQQPAPTSPEKPAEGSAATVSTVPPVAEPSQQTVPPMPSNDRSGNVTLFCVLSYIGILWLVGLIASPEKDDPRVRFHVGQGILLTVVAAILSIAGGIVTTVIKAIFSFGIFHVFSIVAGLIATLITIAISLGLLALMIIGILHAVQGKEEPLPVIGKFAFYN